MGLLHEIKRSSLIPLAGAALAIYYFFVLLPLGRRAQSLDAPLQTAWRNLAAALEQTNATAIDFLRITNQNYETRQAFRQLEDAKQKATERLDVAPALRARMEAIFQLVEYQSERSKIADALSKLAKDQGVKIEPAVFAGFPEHTADVRQPSLLWPALEMIDTLLSTAARCKVGTLHSLEVPLPLTSLPPSTTGTHVAEVPLQLEATGNVTSVAQFLVSLPLRCEELKAAGLPEGKADKPPLYVDRLILKKLSPEKPDEVHLWVRAVGFILTE